MLRTYVLKSTFLFEKAFIILLLMVPLISSANEIYTTKYEFNIYSKASISSPWKKFYEETFETKIPSEFSGKTAYISDTSGKRHLELDTYFPNNVDVNGYVNQIYTLTEKDEYSGESRQLFHVETIGHSGGKSTFQVWPEIWNAHAVKIEVKQSWYQIN